MYHLISGLLNPFPGCFLLTAFAWAFAWWRWPAGRRALYWIGIPFVALTLTTLPPVAYLLMGSLEWHYPPSRVRPGDAEAIVVLGGGLRRPDPGYPYADLGEDTLYRCLLAAELYRAGPPCPIVASGGKVTADQPGPTLAAAMKEFLLQLGVAEEDIVVEDRSRTTHENARESAQLLRDRGLRRVVLVTDAMHLWRAEQCFLKLDTEVIPRGCRYRATHFEPRITSLLPNEGSARDIRRVVHEWLGMAWYWFQGHV